jgi:hypothetical protein
MREVDLCFKVTGHAFIVGEFEAIVFGDGTNPILVWGEAVRNGVVVRRSRLTADPPGKRYTGTCARSIRVTRAPRWAGRSRCRLPSHRTPPGIDNGRTLIDRDPARNVPAPVIGTIAFSPGFLATQTAVLITAGAFVGVEILANALLADAHPLLPLQPGHDLLRSPGLADHPFDVVQDA